MTHSSVSGAHTDHIVFLSAHYSINSPISNLNVHEHMQIAPLIAWMSRWKLGHSLDVLGNISNIEHTHLDLCWTVVHFLKAIIETLLKMNVSLKRAFTQDTTFGLSNDETFQLRVRVNGMPRDIMLAMTIQNVKCFKLLLLEEMNPENQSFCFGGEALNNRMILKRTNCMS